MNRATHPELMALLREIRTGPQGTGVAAFFDFDGTVFHGFSRLHPARTRLGRGSSNALVRSLLTGLSGRKSSAQAKRIHRLISQMWRGRAERDFELIEGRLFSRFTAGNLYPESRQLIRQHRAAGHTLVIVTAATRFHVRSTAHDLGIDHLLCTEAAVADGVVTGAIDGRLLWGQDKADAVAAFATAEGIDLNRSYGYSNGEADVPLLALVGKPIAVNPDRRLACTSVRRGWRVLRFRPRDCAGAYRIVRTLAGLFALLVTVVGVRIRSLGCDRQSAIDRMNQWVPKTTLWCAGLRVEITGAEHTDTPRPAVFLFNHQSQIDTLVIPYVLRTSFTALVAMKVRRYPVFGRLLRFVDMTFVDQSSPVQARSTLDTLVAELRSGKSVAVAPEGRVSPTPQLLPFKKGGFRLATEAGVPIIPIVIRNSGDALWRSSMFVRPGTIEVAVLAPIDVSTWDPDTFDLNVEQVRRLYLDTLSDWPAPVDR
ncbi:HAD-IB family hydrolase [Nocardia colli]|uniref:HAD-IB family hydrolase n=1 Tax=Nocardia colli TaxID=2545717 RepID=UPI0035DC7601